MKTSLFPVIAAVLGIFGTEGGGFASTEGGSSVAIQGRTAQGIWNSRPEWAFQLDGSAETLSGTLLGNSKKLGGIPTANLRFGYQPAFVQSLGVLTLGTSFTFFPVNGSNVGLLKTPSSWAVGAEARYQFRFFRRQWLVPTAAYGVQYLAYKVAEGTSGRAVLRTPSAGLMVLLNSMDPKSAVDFFTGYGASRTYLLTEIRRYGGSDPKITFSGNSFFFGLRIEY